MFNSGRVNWLFMSNSIMMNSFIVTDFFLGRLINYIFFINCWRYINDPMKIIFIPAFPWISCCYGSNTAVTVFLFRKGIIKNTWIIYISLNYRNCKYGQISSQLLLDGPKAWIIFLNHMFDTKMLNSFKLSKVQNLIDLLK